MGASLIGYQIAHLISKIRESHGKSTNQGMQMMAKDGRSTVGIHFFYVVLILGLVIVLLVAFKWTSLAGFTEYLSVAATLTSLVLGIVAIIYGFVSNGSISQSLGSVQTASSRMGKVASDFQSIATSSQALQERAEQRTEKLHGLIGDLQQGLHDLATTTQQISGSVDALSDRISNSQKSASNEPEAHESQSATSTLEESAENKSTRFARRISPMGLLVVYACLQAKRANRYVDILKLVGPRNYEYAWGILVAASSASVVSLEFPSGRRSRMRAVCLKDPPDELSFALDAAWAAAPESKKQSRRRIVEEYAALIPLAYVDEVPDDE